MDSIRNRQYVHDGNVHICHECCYNERDQSGSQRTAFRIPQHSFIHSTACIPSTIPQHSFIIPQPRGNSSGSELLSLTTTFTPSTNHSTALHHSTTCLPSIIPSINHSTTSVPSLHNIRSFHQPNHPIIIPSIIIPSSFHDFPSITPSINRSIIHSIIPSIIIPRHSINQHYQSSFHHSIIPSIIPSSFHQSLFHDITSIIIPSIIIPSIHHSIMPSLHHSIIPSFLPPSTFHLPPSTFHRNFAAFQHRSITNQTNSKVNNEGGTNERTKGRTFVHSRRAPRARE